MVSINQIKNIGIKKGKETKEEATRSRRRIKWGRKGRKEVKKRKKREKRRERRSWGGGNCRQKSLPSCQQGSCKRIIPSN